MPNQGAIQVWSGSQWIPGFAFLTDPIEIGEVVGGETKDLEIEDAGLNDLKEGQVIMATWAPSSNGPLLIVSAGVAEPGSIQITVFNPGVTSEFGSSQFLILGFPVVVA